MKVGVFEKDLPIKLQCVCKEAGVYNLYVPGSLNVSAVKYLLQNPPENVKYLTIYDIEGKDRWKNMIEHIGKELNIKWYRFEKDENGEDFVHYIVDLFDQMPEEFR
jgi:hypothetical protein